LVKPTSGKIVLQRQTAHVEALWARTWWESRYFQLPWHRV